MKNVPVSQSHQCERGGRRDFLGLKRETCASPLGRASRRDGSVPRSSEVLPGSGSGCSGSGWSGDKSLSQPQPEEQEQELSGHNKARLVQTSKKVKKCKKMLMLRQSLEAGGRVRLESTYDVPGAQSFCAPSRGLPELSRGGGGGSSEERSYLGFVGA